MKAPLLLTNPAAREAFFEKMLGGPFQHLDPYAFKHLPQLLKLDGQDVPVLCGGAEQVESQVGSATVTWSAVSATPSLTRLQLIGKACLRQLVLRLSGTYDNSLGTETIGTEGTPVLIDEVRLNVDGRVVRSVQGSTLYEWNRFVNQGAAPVTTPGTGAGTGKAFAATLFLDMGFFDMVESDVHDMTYLDESQYANTWLEVQFGPFNRLTSGGTYANMTATLAVSSAEIIGPRRLPQPHFEGLYSTADMTTTGNDRTSPLVRSNFVLRGIWLRVGTLTATPVITATTALVKVGVKGKLNAGPLTYPVEKQDVANFVNQAGQGRAGITLTAGHAFIDLCRNRKYRSVVVGNTFADLNLVFDSTGTANTTMQIRQLGVMR